MWGYFLIFTLLGFFMHKFFEGDGEVAIVYLTGRPTEKNREKKVDAISSITFIIFLNET